MISQSVREKTASGSSNARIPAQVRAPSRRIASVRLRRYRQGAPPTTSGSATSRRAIRWKASRTIRAFASRWAAISTCCSWQPPQRSGGAKWAQRGFTRVAPGSTIRVRRPRPTRPCTSTSASMRSPGAVRGVNTTSPSSRATPSPPVASDWISSVRVVIGRGVLRGARTPPRPSATHSPRGWVPKPALVPRPASPVPIPQQASPAARCDRDRR